MTMRLNEAILARVREGLEELSDPEFQERVWVRGEGAEVSSPVETISQLFDDSGLGDLLAESKSEPVISATVDGLLTRLSSLVDQVDLGGEPAQVLRAPEWVEVRRTAREVLDAMDNL